MNEAILMRIFLLIICLSLSNAVLAIPVVDCQLKHESVDLLGEQVAYDHAGEGETVLLIHGLFGNKEQWQKVICLIAQANYSVIAVDLPGFGENQHFPLTIYQLEAQVKLLHQLLEELAIDKIHIAGSSMGGAIAALYAEEYPMRISTLTFFGSPLGIVPYAKPFKDAIYQGVNPLIPTTAEEFIWELHLLFAQPPDVPSHVIDKKVQDYIANNKRYTQIWNIVNLYTNALEHPFSLDKPVLILWGDKDNIFDVSGAAKLANQFQTKKASVVILADAGHLPYYDTPDKSAEAVVKFLHEAP